LCFCRVPPAPPKALAKLGLTLPNQHPVRLFLLPYSVASVHMLPRREVESGQHVETGPPCLADRLGNLDNHAQPGHHPVLGDLASPIGSSDPWGQ
jgi:hypothetical protein